MASSSSSQNSTSNRRPRGRPPSRSSAILPNSIPEPVEASPVLPPSIPQQVLENSLSPHVPQYEIPRPRHNFQTIPHYESESSSQSSSSAPPSYPTEDNPQLFNQWVTSMRIYAGDHK